MGESISGIEFPENNVFRKMTEDQVQRSPPASVCNERLFGSDKTGLTAALQMLPNMQQREVISKIEAIWDRISFPPDELEKRRNVFVEAFTSSITTMLDNGHNLQREFEEDLNSCIAQYKKAIDDTQELLAVQASARPENTGVMGLYDQEVSLRQQCNELFSLKDKRKQMLTGLVADNRKFCDALGDSHFTISNPEIRYRMATLDALAEVNATLQQTFMDRSKEMSALHSRIISLITDLKHCEPKLDYNDFSVENLMRAQTSIQELLQVKEDNLVRGRRVCDRIQHLRRRINLDSTLLQPESGLEERLFDPDVLALLSKEQNRLEELSRQNIEQVILGYRERIRDVMEKLCAERNLVDAFPALTSDDFTEQLLDIHETELARLEDYYDDNRLIFDCLAQRKNLLQRKLQLEDQESDPVVMINRGGILLKVQAEKRKAMKEISKVTTDLQAAVAKKTQELGVPFKIGELTFDEYIANQEQYMDERRVTNTRDRKAKDTGSTTKRKDTKDTPTLKRLKTENDPSCNKSSSQKSGKSKIQEPLSQVVLGKVNRKLHFSAAITGEKTRHCTTTPKDTDTPKGGMR